VGLGACLVTQARSASPEPLALVVPCEVPVEAGLVDLDGGASVTLPEVLPEDWRRAPCPSLANVRTVRGRCFLATGERPPCSFGYAHPSGEECIAPAMAAKRLPQSIGR